MCVDGLHDTFRVAEQLRQDRIPDTLNIRAMIWHSFLSLVEYEEALETRASTQKRAKLMPSLNVVKCAKRSRNRASGRKKNPDAFCFFCPAPRCSNSNRAFTLNGLRDHMYVNYAFAMVRI